MSVVFPLVNSKQSLTSLAEMYSSSNAFIFLARLPCVLISRKDDQGTSLDPKCDSSSMTHPRSSIQLVLCKSAYDVAAWMRVNPGLGLVQKAFRRYSAWMRLNARLGLVQRLSRDFSIEVHFICQDTRELASQGRNEAQVRLNVLELNSSPAFTVVRESCSLPSKQHAA